MKPAMKTSEVAFEFEGFERCSMVVWKVWV